MERLQRAAPELYSTMGFPGVGIGSNLGATTTAASPSTTTTTTTTPATDSTTSATPSTPSGKSSLYLARNLKESSPKYYSNEMICWTEIFGTKSNNFLFSVKSGGNNSQQAFSQLMQQMVTSMAGQGLNAPPEERFRTQLETLASMGFVDRQANIQGIFFIIF